ncbi:flagellar basal body P-ring formation chaperone FlgA [Comamonas sp. GB3 AK4-5]|uniref:flagellar basal body P-ring formation chaperone FlgA n=1 Tax=Comamonas sp. GB3 AK4-5 TaxID=3231487 RepID=UPI00351F0AC0
MPGFQIPSISFTVAWWRRGVVAVLGAVALGAVAQPQQSLEQVSRDWLQGAVPQGGQSQDLPLRMEVEIGRLDPRLNLAACARMEPYLPNGSKLWGRTRIAIRCLEGSRLWNVFLPVTVKAWGPAWVLSNNVSMGETLEMQDATQSEVDWAAETASVIAQPEDWVGQTAARPMMAGQTLRQGMVRPPLQFRSGAQVKVLAVGNGFVVTSTGQAMAAGGQGQTVRVRMDNGRIVSGTVNAQGDVVVGQ